MVVYVLLETAESRPLAVLESCDPTDWPELLPRDAQVVLIPTPGPHTNRQVVGTWHSEMLGCTLQLIAYVVL